MFTSKYLRTILLFATSSLLLAHYGNCAEDVSEQARIFKDAFQRADYLQAELALQKIFSNEHGASAFGYDFLRTLTDRYYSLNRMADAERILIKTSDGCYSSFVFDHYYKKLGETEKGLKYIENCLSNLSETDDHRRRNLIEYRAQYAIVPADKKKWWDLWMEDETKDLASKPYLVTRQVKYYIGLGEIDKAITTYESAGNRYITDSDYLFLKNNMDFNGEPLRLYYSARLFDDKKKLEAYNAIIDKYPGSKLTSAILPKALEIANSTQNMSLKVKIASLMKNNAVGDSMLIDTFPSAEAWGLTPAEISAKYDKQIGGIHDFSTEGIKQDVKIVSYILSPKGEIGKGKLLPATLINGHPTPIHNALDYTLAKWTILNTDYFASSMPVTTAHLTSPKREDIIIKVSRNEPGEVGSHETIWKVYRYNTKNNSTTYLLSFDGSRAGDGGESWVTEIGFDDVDKDGLQEVIATQKYDNGQEETGWFQGVMENRTTRVYKYDGISFQIIKTTTATGYAALNGDFLYDDFIGSIPGATPKDNNHTAHRVRLLQWETFPERMKVEFESGMQASVPISNLRATYKSYDKDRVSKLCETIVEPSRINPVFSIVTNEKVSEAINILVPLKDYGLTNNYINLLAALARTELTPTQQAVVWQHATTMFNLYKAETDIPIQKSNMHDEVLGTINQGEEFFVTAVDRKAMIATKRPTDNIGGAIDKNLLQQSHLISTGAKFSN